jgi:hypothetical protein
MAYAERHIGRLVFAKKELLFRAVVMNLQRQARARHDDDSLHLETVAVIDRIVEAPWAANFSMGLSYFPSKSGGNRAQSRLQQGSAVRYLSRNQRLRKLLINMDFQDQGARFCTESTITPSC